MSWPLRQPSRAAPFLEFALPIGTAATRWPGFPRCARGMAVATFNTDTEALEPMAGAALDPLRCPVLRARVAAMKRRSRAGSRPAKARRRRAVKPKGRSAPKAMPRRGSAPAGQGTEVARLTRELNEALEQQTATSRGAQGHQPLGVSICRRCLRPWWSIRRGCAGSIVRGRTSTVSMASCCV